MMYSAPNIDNYRMPHRYWTPPPRFQVRKMEFGRRRTKDVKVRLTRTSTPVREFEETSSFGDSVSEFFYQSWKSDLHAEETSRSRSRRCLSPVRKVAEEPTPAQVDQSPIYYTETVVFVNPMLPLQPPFFTPTTYYPLIGFRPDGSYGVIPGIFWPCV